MAATLLGACSDDGPADLRPWAVASDDAWVDVRLESVSDPGLHLGAVGDVVFGRHDFVYVNDQLRPDVLVLDSILRQVATIGRMGEGPGEFLSKCKLQVLPGDSLLVFDCQRKLLTIFSEARLDSGRVTAVPPFADRLWRLLGPERRHLVMETPAFYAGDSGETDQEHFDVLSILDESVQTVVADAFLSVPQRARLVVRSDNGVRVATHPYSYSSYFKVLPGGGFVHLNNRALSMTFFDNDGSRTGSFSYPTVPIPVTPEHLADRLKELDPAEARLLREGTPYTWSAIRGMIVDEDGRIWVGIRKYPGKTYGIREHPWETHREWAAFTRDGRHVASMRLPTNLWLRAIRGDKLLVLAIGELDVPEIHLYRILWKDGQT